MLRVWGKGSKQRIVPVSEAATEAVSRWIREGRPSMVTSDTAKSSLFLNRAGRSLTPRDVRRILDRRAVSPTHPHALRHTFATHLLDGVPICVLCRKCWVTPISPPPRSIPESVVSACATFTVRPTRAPRTPVVERVDDIDQLWVYFTAHP